MMEFLTDYSFFFIDMGKLQGHSPFKQSHVTLLIKKQLKNNNIDYIYCNWHIKTKYKIKYKN